MLRELISLVYPDTCLKCRDSLISAEKYICTRCKIDLPVTNDHQLPENDLYQKFAFNPLIRSASSYLFFRKGGIAQVLLYQLKYKGKKEVGELLGEWYGKELADAGLSVDRIVPVPLHASKKRKRGYNQSASFAAGLARHLEVPVDEKLVKRVVKTATQTKKSKVERWMNLENVYGEVSEDLSGQSILVVDDVITTGATIGMLCERIREANASAIHVASVARGG